MIQRSILYFLNLTKDWEEMNTKPQLVFESIQFSNRRSGRSSPSKNSLSHHMSSVAIPPAGAVDAVPQAQDSTGALATPNTSAVLNSGQCLVGS